MHVVPAGEAAGRGNPCMKRRWAMSPKRDYLVAELDELTKHFRMDSKKHKLMHRRFRYVILGLTACATILAGIAISFKEYQVYLNLGVVVVTALSGVGAAIEELRNPLKLWIHERNLYLVLKDLKREMDYEASGPDGLKDVDPYFEKLQTVLAASKDEWVTKLVSQPKKPKE
jgi:hypothetical protein